MQVKIHRRLLDRVKMDLARTHPHAAERVGFIFARPDEFGAESALLLAADYWPVPDECYLKDCWVGARINSAAIRLALEKSYASRSSAIHVHEHFGSGKIGFSCDDLDGWRTLIPSFCSAVPEAPHGALVLNETSAAGLVWRSREGAPERIRKISFVGFPMHIHEHERSS